METKNTESLATHLFSSWLLKKFHFILLLVEGTPGLRNLVNHPNVHPYQHKLSFIVRRRKCNEFHRKYHIGILNSCIVLNFLFHLSLKTSLSVGMAIQLFLASGKLVDMIEALNVTVFYSVSQASPSGSRL